MKAKYHTARSIVDVIGMTKSARENTNDTTVKLAKINAEARVAKADIAAKHAEAMAELEAQRPGATVESIIAAANKARADVMGSDDGPPDGDTEGEGVGMRIAEGVAVAGAIYLGGRALGAVVRMIF